MLPEYDLKDVKARLYIRDRNYNKSYYGDRVQLTPGKWKYLSFQIPFLKDVCIEEAGIEWIPVQEERRHGKLPTFIAYVDDFQFSGLPDYEINFQFERLEKWNNLHIEVSQLTYLRGIWALENGELSGSYAGEPAESYTGNLNWKDYYCEVDLVQN